VNSKEEKKRKEELRIQESGAKFVSRISYLVNCISLRKKKLEIRRKK